MNRRIIMKLCEGFKQADIKKEVHEFLELESVALAIIKGEYHVESYTINRSFNGADVDVDIVLNNGARISINREKGHGYSL